MLLYDFCKEWAMGNFHLITSFCNITAVFKPVDDRHTLLQLRYTIFNPLVWGMVSPYGPFPFFCEMSIRYIFSEKMQPVDGKKHPN